jgi:hypothetical protein
MPLINNSKYLGPKIMKIDKYSLYLNKFRKNLAANLDRSPLIKEPLSKSYGVSASPEACRCKAQPEANGPIALSEGCNAADACFRVSPTGLPARFGLGVANAPTFGATSWLATACLRNRA